MGSIHRDVVGFGGMMADFFIRRTGAWCVFEPLTARAKARVSWGRMPVELRSGDAADQIACLIIDGFDVRGEGTYAGYGVEAPRKGKET